MEKNVISLFSGAMGLDIGLEKSGFKIKACVEIDKYACETIRKNTNIPVIEKDINELSTEDLLSVAGLKTDEVFMIAGGPPCQAFSTAGKRRALKDFRGNVIIRFLEIVKDIKPKYFVLENVRGILSTPLRFVPDEYNGSYERILNRKGSVAYFLVKEFEKMGYSTSFSLFNSANYGVPQKRERVVFFGHLGKRVPLPSPTHSEKGFFGTKKWITLKDALEGLDNEQSYIKLSEKSKKYISMLKEGENWTNLPEAVKEEAMGASFRLGGGKTGFYRRLSWNQPSPTLVTSPTMPATMLVHPDELRPLSVQEYARIQQFPDNWEFVGNIQNKYKQIGNAVPVGLGFMIGKTIINFHNGLYDEKAEQKNKIPYSRYKNCSDFEIIPVFDKIFNHQNTVIDSFYNESESNQEVVP